MPHKANDPVNLTGNTIGRSDRAPANQSWRDRWLEQNDRSIKFAATGRSTRSGNEGERNTKRFSNLNRAGDEKKTGSSSVSPKKDGEKKKVGSSSKNPKKDGGKKKDTKSK